MKAIRTITCPSCQISVGLAPGEKQTYEQVYRETAIAHEHGGCEHFRYDKWGYDPEWDGPEKRETIQHHIKMRIVQHPDGYMFSVPADWSQDKINLQIARTRRKKRA